MDIVLAENINSWHKVCENPDSKYNDSKIR